MSQQRLKYLARLLEEYEDMTDAILGARATTAPPSLQDEAHRSARRQTLANLANFCYDPVNTSHLLSLNIIDVFLDCLDEVAVDDAVQHFALAGLCNLSADGRARDMFWGKGDGYAILRPYLVTTPDTPLDATNGPVGRGDIAWTERLLTALTLLRQLLEHPDGKERFCSDRSAVDIVRAWACAPPGATHYDRRLVHMAILCSNMIER